MIRQIKEEALAGSPAAARAHSSHRAGVLLGLACVVLWSSTAMCIRLGGASLDIWQFLAIAATVGGLGQLCFYGLRGKLRGCLFIPGRLWSVVLIGMVGCNICYTLAVGLSQGTQVYGVNLINYLWPVLTVVLALAWVPETRLSGRLAVAIVMALAGLTLANWSQLHAWLTAPTVAESPLPYVLSAGAALTWAVYSALVARWRRWARHFATAPMGFLLLGLLAAGVCLARHQWMPMDVRAWCIVLVAGLGPFGAGYMFWELALHRVPASTLGTMAASIPALSTLMLCVALHQAPDATVLIAAGVLSLGTFFCSSRNTDGNEKNTVTKAKKNLT